MYALEHQVFWPLISQPPSVRVALQASAPTSEPAAGSDIETASTRPSTTPRSTFSFCCGEPNFSYPAAEMIVVANPPIGARP